MFQETWLGFRVQSRKSFMGFRVEDAWKDIGKTGLSFTKQSCMVAHAGRYSLWAEMWQDVNICWSHHDVGNARGNLEVEQNPNTVLWKLLHAGVQYIQICIATHQRPWQKHTLAACRQTLHPLLQSSKILSTTLTSTERAGKLIPCGRQIRSFPQKLQSLSIPSLSLSLCFTQDKAQKFLL